MEYDKIEVKNYLLKRLVDAEMALIEIRRFVWTPENEKAQYPNILTRLDLALEEINTVRTILIKEVK